MTELEALLRAVEADPQDEATQLVLADHLQSVGDPRGKLIVLDHRERHGELHGPDAYSALLWLAAQYGFPRAIPDDPALPFERDDDGDRMRFLVAHAERVYELTGTRLFVRRIGVPAGDDAEEIHSLRLDHTTPDMTVVLQIVSDAIRANTPFEDLYFPGGTRRFPQYEGSPLRCYMLPIDYLHGRELRYDHAGLAARDYHRWHAIRRRFLRLAGLRDTAP